VVVLRFLGLGTRLQTEALTAAAAAAITIIIIIIMHVCACVAKAFKMYQRNYLYQVRNTYYDFTLKVYSMVVPNKVYHTLKFKLRSINNVDTV